MDACLAVHMGVWLCTWVCTRMSVWLCTWMCRCAPGRLDVPLNVWLCTWMDVRVRTITALLSPCGESPRLPRCFPGPVAAALPAEAPPAPRAAPSPRQAARSAPRAHARPAATTAAAMTGPRPLPASVLGCPARCLITKRGERRTGWG